MRLAEPGRPAMLGPSRAGRVAMGGGIGVPERMDDRAVGEAPAWLRGRPRSSPTRAPPRSSAFRRTRTLLRCTVAQHRRTQMRSIGRPAIHATLVLITLLSAALGPPVIAGAQAPASYTDVTEARLLNPEPQNWLMYRGNYSGWGYSPLDRITPANVKKLVPVWTLSTGVTEGHQAPPIVNNGMMFITTPQQQVIALNAKTGEVIWRYKKELPVDLLQLHATNQGVGLWEDKVYIGTVDAHVVALEAKTGQVVWDKP